MKYKRFEELPCWNKARELSQAVFHLISSGAFRKDFILKEQIWRATGSIMDNIAEGFDDGSSRGLIRFLGYSQRSCSEVQSQLYRALDSHYIEQTQFDRVYEFASECRRQIKGFRKYLRDYNRKDKVKQE
ncbi:MAG: four helix bundle protein [bacterium]